MFGLSLLLLSFQGCKDDEDTESPRVRMSEPMEFDVFSAIDTFEVSGTITDNNQIVFVELSIETLDYEVAVKAQRFFLSGSTVNFGTTYILDEPLINGGQYYFVMRASDGENVGSDYQQIQINPIPREVERYFLVTKQTNLATLHESESLTTWEPIREFNLDATGAALNYRQDIFGICGGTLGDATFYETEEFDVVSSYPNLGTISSPYFLGLQYDRPREEFYLLQEEPSFRVLDKNAFGVNVPNTQFGFEPHAVFPDEDNYFVPEGEVTSQIEVLSYYTQAGLLASSVTLAGEAKLVTRKSFNEEFVWQSGSSTVLSIFNKTTELLSQVFSRPDESLKSVIEIEQGVFIFSTDEGMYRYNYGNGGTVVLPTDRNPNRMLYDDLNGIIYGWEDQELYAFAPNGQILNTWKFTSPIVEFMIDYNR